MLQIINQTSPRNIFPYVNKRRVLTIEAENNIRNSSIILGKKGRLIRYTIPKGGVRLISLLEDNETKRRKLVLRFVDISFQIALSINK